MNLGLEQCRYIRVPELSWDTMLKIISEKLQLLFDNLHVFDDRRRDERRNLTYCTHRYSYVNNKYMSDCDENREGKYLVYQNANNQYEWGMLRHLTTTRFRYLTDEEIDNFDVNNILYENKKCTSVIRLCQKKCVLLTTC